MAREPFHQLLRRTLALNLGNELTPELAARIEACAGFGGNPIDVSHVPLVWSGRLSFRVERLESIRHEVEALHEEYRAEIDPDYAPDVSDLIWREQRGRLLQFTARAGSDLVGHARAHVGHLDPDHDRRIALDDTIYLRPEFRAGRAVLRFVQFIEDVLATVGVEQFRIHAPYRQGLFVMASRLGYVKTHSVMQKSLETNDGRIA